MIKEHSNPGYDNANNIFGGVKNLATAQYNKITAYNSSFTRFALTKPKSPIEKLTNALHTVINERSQEQEAAVSASASTTINVAGFDVTAPGTRVAPASKVRQAG